MRSLRPLLRVLSVATLGAVGALLAWLSDGSFAATVVLLAEPLLWVALSWLVWWVWTNGARGSALALLLGGVAAALACRAPLAPDEPVGMDEAPFASRLRTCARSLTLPGGPVRIVRWSPELVGPGFVEAVTEATADVVIIRAPLSEALVEAIRAGVGGEVMELEGVGASTWVFARGVFDSCGHSNHWFDHPSPGAELGAVFVQLEGGTRLPLLTATMPPPRAVARWSRHTADARAALAATANTLESSLLVVAVEAPYALAAPRMTQSLLRAGLLPMARRPNWPGVIPVHTFDQIWAAEAWVAGDSAVLSAPGAGRLGQLAELSPRWPVTLPASRDGDPVRHEHDRRVEHLQHHARAE